MRKYLFINIVFLLTLSLVVKAQEVEDFDAEGHNPFEEISKKKSAKSGKVRFFQDERIESLIKENVPAENAVVNGFRVQVFSSNSHATAKRDAFNIEQKLKSAYPYMSVYISYSSPFWKVRIGDFLNQEEAKLFLDELVRKLPELKRETYIVKERIYLSAKSN